ncbi:MAG: coproporphyrinogen dehydrogenase HemZ [Oscillospiraceae bacterium]|nr:coproporphyrinogen dehydrogenase HemZ [Oscillospiraceae bacterium]
MILIINGYSSKYELESLSNMFFQGARVTVTDEDKRATEAEYIFASFSQEGEEACFFVEVRCKGETRALSQREPWESADQSRCDHVFGQLLYRLLSAATGIAPAWGILTGVRPVKLIHRFRREGLSDPEIRRFLTQECYAAEEKADLALRTADREEAIVALSRPDSVSLYVSIPFCPSRCRYCSFVSHAIEKAWKLIPDYLLLLRRELEETAGIVKQLGLRLETVYFGGGTPTSITAPQLEGLIDTIEKNFDLSSLREYTVEAGRPDTITPEKLQMLRRRGVTRISINPQTLNDSVLEEIGRRHTTAQTLEAYAMARAAGHDNINMDLIAGLPGDDLESFCRTIEGVIGLAPDNITLHTLSVKRSSDLRDAGEDFYRREHVRVTGMLSYATRRLREEDYLPYYLYRQKNTMDNLENVGYCRAGKEGYYNVYIMDETHSILAVGAGGVSKLKEPAGNRIERIFNYKYPYEYISRFETVLERKKGVEAFYTQKR